MSAAFELDGDNLDSAAELRALERALSLTEGFSLLFVVCNQPDHRRGLMAQLRERLPDLNPQTVIFAAPIRHLLDELRQNITAAPGALFVSGLENSLSSDDAPRAVPLIANLNAARNSLPGVVPCPLVLWVPHYVLTAIAAGAPDFYSVRSGVYFFAATPQQTTALAQSLTSGEEGTAASLPLAEKLARITSLQSLLADYQAQSATQRDLPAEMRLLNRLGNLLSSLGRARESIPIFEQVLQTARDAADRSYEGKALGNLGIAYAYLGETRRAVEFYEQQLAIVQAIGDRRGEGNALGNLGNAYADLGETRRAIEFYEQYLAIAREIGNRRGEGNSLGNLGAAYADLGERRRAIEYHEQALAVMDAIGDRRGEGNILGNLGLAYAALGETRRAIEFYEQQLTIVREIGDRRGEGNACWNMALALESLGERARTVELAQASLDIFEAIEDPNAAMVRAKLAAWRGAS